MLLLLSPWTYGLHAPNPAGAIRWKLSCFSLIHVHAYGTDKLTALQQLNKLEYWRTYMQSLFGGIALPCFVPAQMPALIKLGPGLNADITTSSLFASTDAATWEKLREEADAWHPTGLNYWPHPDDPFHDQNWGVTNFPNMNMEKLEAFPNLPNPMEQSPEIVCISCPGLGRGHLPNIQHHLQILHTGKLNAFGPTHVQQDKQHKDEKSWKLVMQPFSAPTTHLVIFKMLLDAEVAQAHFRGLKKTLQDLLPVTITDARERYPNIYVTPMPAHLHMPQESLDLAANVLLRVIINSARGKGQNISMNIYGHSAGSFLAIWVCNRLL
jgi:hypothetical protein